MRSDTARSGPEPGRVGTIELAADGPHHIARLTGEVDAAVVHDFSGRSARDGTGALVTAVDAAQVTFLDSSGLSLLLRWAARARSRGLTTELRSASPAVLDLLRMSGTAALFSGAADRVAGHDGPTEQAAGPAGV